MGVHVVMWVRNDQFPNDGGIEIAEASGTALRVRGYYLRRLVPCVSARRDYAALGTQAALIASRWAGFESRAGGGSKPALRPAAGSVREGNVGPGRVRSVSLWRQRGEQGSRIRETGKQSSTCVRGIRRCSAPSSSSQPTRQLTGKLIEPIRGFALCDAQHCTVRDFMICCCRTTDSSIGTTSGSPRRHTMELDRSSVLASSVGHIAEELSERCTMFTLQATPRLIGLRRVLSPPGTGSVSRPINSRAEDCPDSGAAFSTDGERFIPHRAGAAIHPRARVAVLVEKPDERLVVAPSRPTVDAIGHHEQAHQSRSTRLASFLHALSPGGSPRCDARNHDR